MTKESLKFTVQDANERIQALDSSFKDKRLYMIPPAIIKLAALKPQTKTEAENNLTDIFDSLSQRAAMIHRKAIVFSEQRLSDLEKEADKIIAVLTPEQLQSFHFDYQQLQKAAQKSRAGLLASLSRYGRLSADSVGLEGTIKLSNKDQEKIRIRYHSDADSIIHSVNGRQLKSGKLINSVRHKLELLTLLQDETPQQKLYQFLLDQGVINDTFKLKIKIRNNHLTTRTFDDFEDLKRISDLTSGLSRTYSLDLETANKVVDKLIIWETSSTVVSPQKSKQAPIATFLTKIFSWLKPGANTESSRRRIHKKGRDWYLDDTQLLYNPGEMFIPITPLSWSSRLRNLFSDWKQKERYKKRRRLEKNQDGQFYFADDPETIMSSNPFPV